MAVRVDMGEHHQPIPNRFRGGTVDLPTCFATVSPTDLTNKAATDKMGYMKPVVPCDEQHLSAFEVSWNMVALGLKN